MSNKEERARALGQEFGGKEGMAIGKIREQFIIAWLARWRYSSYEVMALALGAKPKSIRDKLTKMQNKKIVVKQPTVFSPSGYVYTLTAVGERMFRDISNRKIPKRLDASKLKTNSLIPHDLGVQVVIAENWRTGNVKSFMTQFELKLKYRDKLPILPDAFYINKNDGRCAVEFEATMKTERRMLGKYYDLRNDISTVESGYIDKHWKAMRGWMDDNSEYWEFVEYTLLSDKQVKTYQKYVNTYIKRRVSNPDHRNGWRDSFVFSDAKVMSLVSSIIYDKQVAEPAIVSIL